MQDHLTFPLYSILACPEALALGAATMWTEYHLRHTRTRPAVIPDKFTYIRKCYTASGFI